MTEGSKNENYYESKQPSRVALLSKYDNEKYKRLVTYTSRTINEFDDRENGKPSVPDKVHGLSDDFYL